MQPYTYLLLNLGAILVPFIFSFHPKLRFDRKWKAFWPACVLVAAFFIIWDVYFTKIGVWGFNPDYLIGLNIAGLPLEEWLFFITIPYACVFTYHCFLQLLYLDNHQRKVSIITLILLIQGIIMVATSFPKWYTSSTFILLSATLILLYRNRPNWLSYFFLSYLVVLLPFFIINGVLTGSWIEEPVVWYNNSENLGFRLGTIPYEDVFYGMLLILLNVMLFEFFKNRFALTD